MFVHRRGLARRPALLPALCAAAGFASGLTNPSRDLIVRATTPPGSTGKVYGFVYSGLDVGSMVTPVYFGWLLDGGAAVDGVLHRGGDGDPDHRHGAQPARRQAGAKIVGLA